MVSLWNHFGGYMTITITLKNIPDEIYARLKVAAQANHRSINSEVIACLERTLLSARVTGEERLTRARQLRSPLPSGKFKPEDIIDAIEQGRP